jgi:hypothetical protein
MKPLVAMLALILVVPAVAVGQQPITKGTTTRGTATIQAIDTTTRTVTLRTMDGEEDSFRAGPGVTRFNELKVGDTVNITYIESLVVQVRKPGTSTPTGTTGDAAVTAGSGARPAETVAAQLQTTVTVKAIHPSVPSITVLTDDGRTVTRKIDDRKNLQDIKAGDKLDITYTQAVLMSVAPTPKK